MALSWFHPGPPVPVRVDRRMPTAPREAAVRRFRKGPRICTLKGLASHRPNHSLSLVSASSTADTSLLSVERMNLLSQQVDQVGNRKLTRRSRARHDFEAHQHPPVPIQARNVGVEFAPVEPTESALVLNQANSGTEVLEFLICAEACKVGRFAERVGLDLNSLPIGRREPATGSFDVRPHLQDFADLGADSLVIDRALGSTLRPHSSRRYHAARDSCAQISFTETAGPMSPGHLARSSSDCGSVHLGTIAKRLVCSAQDSKAARI